MLDICCLSSPAVISLVVCAITFAYYVLKNRGLPPGPLGLPYLGYWPFFDDKAIHLQMEAMKKKYGDVFSFTCTGRLYINLGSVKALKEAHITKGDCFGQRFTAYTLMRYMIEDSIVFLNDEDWKSQRKFYLRVLKERSFKYIQDAVSGALDESLASTVGQLRAREGELVNIFEMMVDKCGENIRLAVFGDVGATSDQVREVNRLFGESFTCMAPSNVLLIGKFARYCILPWNKEFQKLNSVTQKAQEILQEIVDDHKSTYDGGNIRNIIDAYLKEREDRKEKGDSSASAFTDKSLVSSLFQFIGDGVSGVSAVIGNALVLLVKHPDAQEKIHQEVVEVIGEDRLPSIEDKPRMTYTNAFIMETLRVGENFPFFPSQECVRETTVGGFRIPKGAITLMNIYNCNFDSETYENPTEFNPSRFTSEGGRKREELPIIFGIGKRACLGESFAMTEIFLLLTTIIQNFRLSLPPGKETSFMELMISQELQIYAKPRRGPQKS